MDAKTPIRWVYETKTDVVPEFWQFLRNLRSDDLVAELIQNEIDAGSTHTILSFDEDRFRWRQTNEQTGAGH